MARIMSTGHLGMPPRASGSRPSHLNNANNTRVAGRVRASSVGTRGVVKYSDIKLCATPSFDQNGIPAFYKEAKRLTRETGIVYTVDHIIPIKGEFVTGLHVASNLQILTLRDNCRKGNKYNY